MTTRPLQPTRLRVSDMARLGTTGMRTRPLRAVLAALGIGVGVAAMIAIVGISSSSRAEVDQRIEELGPNVLQVTPAANLDGKVQPLPTTAEASIRRIDPVTATTQLAQLPLSVYRNDHVPTGQTGSLSVAAVTPTLLSTLNASVAFGSWFDPVTLRFPAVVLGAGAAKRLGVQHTGTSVWLGGQWCTVVGVLNPVPIAPSINNSALVGWQAARDYFHFTGHPTTVYVRADQGQVDAVDSVLARSISPSLPQFVTVTRPSDAIAARMATSALSGLLLGLGGVALLIGGIGVANTMVVSIMERRSEIGLRRSMGATRRQIRGQFVAEAVLLSLFGGAAGTFIGTVITQIYAYLRHWPAVVPAWASVAGLGATILIGAAAGWYPAMRAGRLSPTEALTAI